MPSPAADPQICLMCGGDFVHPVRWEPSDDRSGWVQLRCGSCESWREDLFDAKALERFDRKLSKEERLMTIAADRLHRAWRSEEADAFASALDRDLIDAGDFAR